MTEERMSRQDIKEFIFDDLLEFLEMTGSSGSVTPEDIAEMLDDKPSRVKGCMRELETEGVLTSFKEDDVEYFSFTDDLLAQLLAEMEESGWVPPGDDDDENAEDEPE